MDKGQLLEQGQMGKRKVDEQPTGGNNIGSGPIFIQCTMRFKGDGPSAYPLVGPGGPVGPMPPRTPVPIFAGISPMAHLNSMDADTEAVPNSPPR